MERITFEGPNMRTFVLAVLAACLALASPARAQSDSVSPPDTKVGRELAWVLRVLNGEPLGDIKAKFTPRFIEEFGEKDIRETLTTLRAKSFGGAKVNLVRVYESELPDQLEGAINGEKTDKFLSVFITLDDKSGLIAGLLFNVAGYSCQAGDWDSYEGELGRLSGTVALGCYELLPRKKDEPDGEVGLSGVYEFHERDSLAIAGAYKLWVLAAAARRIDAGQLKWTDAVALRSDRKSVPGGELQQRADGSEVSVRELAERMISRSDFTAADHLFGTIGRGPIDEYVSATLRDGRRTLPVLTSRQFFRLKLTKDEALRQQYAAAGKEARERMLADERAVGNQEPEWDLLDAWNEPRDVGGTGWFSSAEDMCRVLADLRRLERRPGMEPLGAALRKDSGPLELNKATWKSVGYKGGGEPGVLAHFWLLERDDGRWFAMGVIWNKEKEDVSEERLAELSRAAIAILDKHARPGAGDGK